MRTLNPHARAVSILVAVILGGCGGHASSYVPAGSTARSAPAAPARSLHPLDYLGQGALVTETFANQSTALDAWSVSGGACLTAGDASTPTTSIPACSRDVPLDPSGSGALQLVPSRDYQTAEAVYNGPLFTSSGLQFTFTYSAFGGKSADGMTLFIASAVDAPIPSAAGGVGGSLGYAGGPGRSGLANGYVGIGFDEYGDYSLPASGRAGGPGHVAQTVAVRGAASTGYSYLTGYRSNNAAASLPFRLDAPQSSTRPATSPTFQVTLTKAALLTLEVDRHDGSGFEVILGPTELAGGSQPPLPSQVYFGFTASTGGSAERHEITNLSVRPAQALGSVLESFTGAATTPNAWNAFGAACLTAGSGAPQSSIPGCTGTVSDPPASLPRLFHEYV